MGTLIVKPKRHVGASVGSERTEAAELGVALKQTTGVVAELTAADQLYVCRSAHAGGVPGHIHFVQP